MDRGGLQRLIPIILILIIVVVAVAALISLGRTLFSGSGEQAEPAVNIGNQALTNTNADRSISMSVRGPIVANEDHYSYTIMISPETREITTYRGYLHEELENDQFKNNKQAYEQLVYALSRANLMEGTPLQDEANDTRGICATGLLYEFEVRQGENSIQKLWTTTCSGSKGSLKANASQVGRLFKLQIPTFDAVTSKIKLNY